MVEQVSVVKIKPELQSKVQLFLGGIKQFPALPDVYFKIKQAFENPSVSVEYIANAIRLDQSLTISILRLANSPFFGFRNKISSISQAVMLIGLREIYSLVLSISVMGLFPANGEDKIEKYFPLKPFWEHSLAVAVSARFLAKRLRHPNPEELFVAGLIHDIGKLVERLSQPAEFEKVCVLAKEKHKFFLDAELELWGFSHAEIGALLAEHWAFPSSLATIVAYHHHPSAIEDNKLAEAASIVHVADCLARSLNIGWSGDPYVPPIDSAALLRLRIEPASDLPSILFRVQHEYNGAIQSLMG